ncbi:MAG: nucleotidyltransferase family protein, partial [Oscillospiraceae bacterium]|nr:nucleotidyltransferase family protein [Oscillospiraceae bacterium]
MEQQHIGILRLIKSALIGQPQPLPEGFSLEQAYPLVREHQLQPMIYEGAVVCGFSRQLPVMKQLFQEYCRALMRSEGQMKAVDELCAAFEQGGVDYLFFKGSVLKRLYPKPELRPMGDADVLIRTQQQPQADEILQRLGYEWKVENEQEALWYSPALALEPHRSLVSAKDRDFYSYFGDGWQLVERDKDGKARLSPEDEFAFVFVHMAKHYRGGGIGVRQLVDLWVYERMVPQLDD